MRTLKRELNWVGTAIVFSLLVALIGEASSYTVTNSSVSGMCSLRHRAENYTSNGYAKIGNSRAIKDYGLRLESLIGNAGYILTPITISKNDCR